MVDEAQTSAIDFITADIRKRLSDPSVIYNLHDRVEDFPALSCGISCIDKTLRGGIPEGRIVELYGPEASGKTTVLLHFIAAAQKRGEIVYFVDAENSLDLQYAMRIGVVPTKMLFSQPDYGEQALEVMEAICDAIIEFNEKHDKKMKGLIVLDSVAALVPKQEFERSMDQVSVIGSRARMLSERLPKVCTKARKSGASVVFIDQIRDKIGVTWGPTTTTPGGRALKFYASVRIYISRIGHRKIGDAVVGIRAQLRVEKSKLFPIFDSRTEFYIGADGIDEVAALVECCIVAKIFTKSGAWLKFGEHNLQGQSKMEEAVRGDAGLRGNLEAKLLEVSG